MENYRPNSHKSKEEKPKKKNLKKVVKGTVSVKEKTAPHKFFRSLLAEDAKTIENHVVKNVIKPKILDIIFDACTVGLEMALFGEASRRRSSKKGSYTSYGDYYNGGSSSRSSKSSKNDNDSSTKTSRRTIYDLEEIEFKYREDAEAVLDQMCEVLKEYPAVTGADLCELLGKPVNYTDRKFGWTNLSNASIDYIKGGGYVLSLPRAEVLE